MDLNDHSQAINNNHTHANQEIPVKRGFEASSFTRSPVDLKTANQKLKIEQDIFSELNPMQELNFSVKPIILPQKDHTDQFSNSKDFKPSLINLKTANQKLEIEENIFDEIQFDENMIQDTEMLQRINTFAEEVIFSENESSFKPSEIDIKTAFQHMKIADDILKFVESEDLTFFTPEDNNFIDETEIHLQESDSEEIPTGQLANKFTDEVKEVNSENMTNIPNEEKSLNQSDPILQKKTRLAGFEIADENLVELKYNQTSNSHIIKSDNKDQINDQKVLILTGFESILGATESELNLLKQHCKDNSFHVNISETHITIGKGVGNKNQQFGILNGFGMALNELHHEQDLTNLQIIFAENMTEEDKEIVQGFLKNLKIYFIPIYQLNQLQLLHNQSIENAEMKEKIGSEKLNSKTQDKNLVSDNHDMSKNKTTASFKKPDAFSHSLKVKLNKERKNREKRYRDEAFEMNQERLHKATLEKDAQISKKQEEDKEASSQE